MIVELDLPDEDTRIDLEFEIHATYLIFESSDGTIRIRMEHDHMERLGSLMQEHGYPTTTPSADSPTE